MELGELLRRHRVRLGLSQDELAARSAMSIRAIRDLEHGRVGAPRAQTVHRLAVALDLVGGDLDTLLRAATASAPSAPTKASPAEPAHRGRPWIGVLGPLAFELGGMAQDMASPMRRSLLALLALHPHQVVAREEIVDTLWGPHPPRTCLSLVHVYVGQLRTLLEPQRARGALARTVVLAGGGYRLEVEPEQVDAAEFDALLARANRARAAGEHEQALNLYAAASGLWRGPVLSDVAGAVRAHPTAVALSQRRVTAALALAEMAGRLNRLEDAVPWLRTLARDEALHEVLHARLMLALGTTGEQAAALRIYAELRDRLSEELGIAPGSELQDAHVRVLRQDYHRGETAGPVMVHRPAPAQLPPDVAAFTGRVEPLRELTELVATAGPAVVIAAITGTAGVGKTALAVHFAHQVRERYPDGQLYVNLRGYAAAPPVRPIEALAAFLVALGVPAEQIPLDVDQASALYRSLLADKRVLVLLDNVGDVSDIRTMLPGGAGSLVLVTSRDQLAGLVARDGARRIGLDVLAPGEAHTLLGRLVGPDRVLAELEATVELASLCAGLPLALRIAAANLTAQQQHTLAGYAADLRAGNRLAALVVDGDEETAVRAAFDLSYTALPEPARRLFRLLGLVPGPDVSAEVAAALAGIDREEALRLLDRLVGAHLIENHRPGRYAFHDLLRLYAREQSTVDDGAAALLRLYTYYLHRAHEAAGPLFGHMFRIPLSTVEDAPALEPFPDTAAAVAWYDAERAGILAAAAAADTQGPRRFAWLLTDAIRGYLLLRMYTVDWSTAARAGLAAAEAEGDRIGQFAMLLSLGSLSLRQSRHSMAIEYYNRARELARQAGLAGGESMALTNLGGVHVELGQLSRAAEFLRTALDVGEQSSYRGARMNNLGNLGSVSLYLGRLELAESQFREAVRLAEGFNSLTVYSVDLTNLGESLVLLGRYDEAKAALNEALAGHRSTGNRSSEAAVLRCLSIVERERGRLGLALELAEQAVGHAAGCGHRRVEAQARSALAAVHLARGEAQFARDHWARALRLAGDTGHPQPEVDARIGLARAERALGHHQEARAHLDQALAAAQASEFGLLEARALTERAALRIDLGQPEAARVDAERALAMHEVCGYPMGMAETLVLLGHVGPQGPDVAQWRRALDIYTRIGAVTATLVSELIDSHEVVRPRADDRPRVGQNGQHQEGSIP